MFYSSSDGQYVQENTPFSINGIQFPANWLNHASPEEKASVGLEEVVTVGERGDDRFYWTGESLVGATLTYTNTPKQLQDDLANFGQHLEDFLLQEYLNYLKVFRHQFLKVVKFEVYLLLHRKELFLYLL